MVQNKPAKPSIILRPCILDRLPINRKITRCYRAQKCINCIACRRCAIVRLRRDAPAPGEGGLPAFWRYIHENKRMDHYFDTPFCKVGQGFKDANIAGCAAKISAAIVLADQIAILARKPIDRPLIRGGLFIACFNSRHQFTVACIGRRAKPGNHKRCAPPIV